jgi:hypothetical protein
METSDREGELNPLRGPWAALAAPADGTPGRQEATRSGVTPSARGELRGIDPVSALRHD